MEYLFELSIGVIALIYVCYKLFQYAYPEYFKKGAGIDTKNKSTQIKSLLNEKIKPNDEILEECFPKEKFELYKFLKTELMKLGEVTFLWRGLENGWVLSLKEGNGMLGSVILSQESSLVAQIWEVRRDYILNASAAVIDHFDVDEFPLTTREDILRFVELINSRRESKRNY